MATGSAVKKIAILGGGISALTTAFELTSQPDWQSRFDITVYQLGWRLGGKCATARGPNARIEEHGIHGFLGSYYNALPLMADCYAALGRQPGQPLATFEEAFHPDSFMLMWEFQGAQEGPHLQRWPFTAPTNALMPNDPSSLQTINHWLTAVVGFVDAVFEAQHASVWSVQGIEIAAGRALFKQLQSELAH
ncbi:MAG: NAD(P)-binding protein, partial [Burkholderiaceae bacterium]